MSDERRPNLLLPFRLAWRELVGSKAFALSFIINLSLGLTGFLALTAFKQSIASHIESRSKSILAADLAISGTRALTGDEEKEISAALPAGSLLRREDSLMSMAAIDKPGGAARLVEVRAVDEQFPYYGTLKLKGEDGKPSTEIEQASDKRITRAREAWVYPEILIQLDAKVGDALKIGAERFTITAVIDSDPAMSSIGFAVAPKVMIGRQYLEDTQLLGKGSRVFRSLLAKLPPGSDEAAVAKQVRTALKSNEIRVRTHATASEELSRLLIYLNDYLGLVALVALFLAGVGAAFLFRSYLTRRYKDIAILMSLGAGLAMTRCVYVVQLLGLGAAATLVSCVLARAVLPALPHLLAGIVPTDLHLGLTAGSVGLALVMGSIGSLVFCLPLLARLSSIKPSELFQEAASPRLETSGRAVLYWVPALVLYWLLAVWQAHSWRTGSLFVGLFLGSGAVFALAALLLLKLIEADRLRPLAALLPKRGVFGRLAGLNLARHKAASLTCLLAISLGSLLVNVIPQIKTTMQKELLSPKNEDVPGLFLFDIQDEQLEPLKADMEARKMPLRYISPLVRARLAQINGVDVERRTDLGDAATREEEQASRTQNRGYNLSFRLGSAPSETVVQGPTITTPWDPNDKALPQISLEQRFAERLGVKIGDKLTFDVQGVPVEGQVVNLRRVRWASFHPNFFVQFQPGPLDDAPKSWLAAIPELPVEEKVKVQTELVKSFPNVSIIDVSSTVDRILGIVEQMSSAISFMALLSLAAGIAVLFSIARYQAATRLRDMALLKVLGAGFGDLRYMLAAEFLILGMFAATLGGLVSVGVSYALSVIVFDGFFSADLVLPFIVAATIGLVCVLTGLAAAGKSLRTQPALLLGGNQL